MHSENSTHAPFPMPQSHDQLVLQSGQPIPCDSSLDIRDPEGWTAPSACHSHLSLCKQSPNRQALRSHWLTTRWMGQHLYAQCWVGGEGRQSKGYRECRTEMASANSLQSFLCVDCLPSNSNASARTAVISSTPSSTAWHRTEAPQHTPNAQARGSASSLTYHSGPPCEAWKVSPGTNLCKGETNQKVTRESFPPFTILNGRVCQAGTCLPRR